MGKAMLLFPDGVGIRNYLYSDVFKGMEQDLVLFHNFDTNTEEEISQITNIKHLKKIPKYNESVKEKFLRELICLLRLKNNVAITNNPTILSNWKKKHQNLKNTIFYAAIQFFAKFSFNYSRIEKLEKSYQNAIRNTAFYNEVATIIKEIEPKKIFCSHQRGLQCATIFAVAKDLGIETITVIYSWDNLPKARMALRADKYLVWSTYMKNELQLYYPEIKEDQIFITGTPQFECFQNPENIIPKEEFYSRYNLDLNKKIICFSGDDLLTSPDDPKYLNDLADELIKNKLDKEYQILLRRCPVDISGRFDEVVSKYPEFIKEAPPLWNFQSNENWVTIYPLPEDVKLLVSTSYYSETVINLGSTMAFDFEMFNKPCIYINYDQLIKENPNWSVKTIYQFQHFRSLTSKNCVKWWSKKEEISRILKNCSFDKEMENWTAVILEDFTGASKKINNILNN